ncbi:MAG: TonB-dependent receptor [Rhodoferax sp.]|uniref:TonB-dependent receptor n=1 Tax=Rhodoferax sp. TaxID=50421 RepID=UPI00260FA30F|nr:TonB-dependent receptor [Rhodoferax sp.]MDD2881404.1 TonB-dependent receptor [Rhodoferax sp.]
MKTFVTYKRGRAPVRFGASVLAVFAAFPVLAQGQSATLKEVVVSATRFDSDAASLPFGVSVITKDDIARAGVSTVNEAVVKLLGVPGRADFYGGGDYGLDLRGFGTTAGSNQVVIVDGIKVNEADLSGTRLAGIAINTVERIEVMRGSGSVLYGAGATGGVIVITTKAGRGVARQNSVDLYAATGSYGLNELRANATLASGGFSLDVAGNKRQTDNHRDNFKSTVDGQSVQAQWSNDWLRVGASHANDTLDTGLPGSLTAVQYETNPSQTTAANANKTGSIENTRDTLFANAELGAWQLGLDAGQRTKSLDSLNKGVSTYRYDIDASTLAVRAKHGLTLGQTRNALTLGHDQADWKRTTPGAYGSVSQQKSSAFYVQDEVTYASGTRLSAGYRSENIKQTDTFTAGTDQDQAAWELGLTQPISSAWSVFGRVGNSFRLANMDELGFTLPGAVLQPQTSRDLELGSRWKYTGGRVELRIYRSSLANELGYDPTVANANSWNGFGANVNFDPTLRQGLELEAQHDLSKTVGVQLNLGVREAKFTQGAHNGLTVPLVAGTTLSVRADWRPAPTHSVNAGVVWVSSQNVDFNNACTVPSYATVDARYAYQRRNVELSLGFSNLLDAKYYTQAFSCAVGVTNGIYPEAGRAVTAAMRVSF